MSQGFTQNKKMEWLRKTYSSVEDVINDIVDFAYYDFSDITRDDLFGGELVAEYLEREGFSDSDDFDEFKELFHQSLDKLANALDKYMEECFKQYLKSKYSTYEDLAWFVSCIDNRCELSYEDIITEFDKSQCADSAYELNNVIFHIREMIGLYRQYREKARATAGRGAPGAVDAPRMFAVEYDKLYGGLGKLSSSLAEFSWRHAYLFPLSSASIPLGRFVKLSFYFHPVEFRTWKSKIVVDSNNTVASNVTPGDRDALTILELLGRGHRELLGKIARNSYGVLAVYASLEEVPDYYRSLASELMSKLESFYFECLGEAMTLSDDELNLYLTWVDVARSLLSHVKSAEDILKRDSLDSKVVCVNGSLADACAVIYAEIGPSMTIMVRDRDGLPVMRLRLPNVTGNPADLVIYVFEDIEVAKELPALLEDLLRKL